jgi:hypothetical protein
MIIGKLKEIIALLPDDYILQIEVAVHPDDLSDVLEESLVVKSSAVNEKIKCFRLKAGLWNLAHAKQERES